MGKITISCDIEGKGRTEAVLNVDELRQILTAANMKNASDLKKEGMQPIGELVSWVDGSFNTIKLENKLESMRWLNARRDAIDSLRTKLRI